MIRENNQNMCKNVKKRLNVQMQRIIIIDWLNEFCVTKSCCKIRVILRNCNAEWLTN